jgi:hypothetical protein
MRTISGVLLVTGRNPGRGEAIDLFDANALAVGTVEELLAFAADRIPADIAGLLTVDRHEREVSLRVATATAGAVMPPPWRVRGTIRRNHDETWGFELLYEFRDRDVGTGGTRYTGTCDNAAVVREFAESARIDDWHQFRLTRTRRTLPGGKTLYDMRAQPVSPPYRTIGELRPASWPFDGSTPQKGSRQRPGA